MARPKSPDPLAAFGFRLPQQLVERIDAYARKVEQQLPGHRVRRSDAIRVLLEKALAAEGIAEPKAPKRK